MPAASAASAMSAPAIAPTFLGARRLLGRLLVWLPWLLRTRFAAIRGQFNSMAARNVLHGVQRR